jgi:uncharacterized protein involved in type VI secretion and phage assembly
MPDDNAFYGGFYGKYRGTVLDNVDPQQTGRLQVAVPDVAGVLPSTWALPCLPFASLGAGFYAVPDIGANVWVEFEQGDPDYPIWTGCFWGDSAEVPPLALAGSPDLQQVVIQTTGQATLLISDTPGPSGGILLQTPSGAMISLSDSGIVIDNGQGASITLAGPKVTLNDGALEVA